MSPTMHLEFTEVFNVQSRLHQAEFEVVKSVDLYNFNGEPNYAAVHG
jgi:isocitrate dehydrogenase